MSNFAGITIYGEKPDTSPNLSPCAAFKEKYPVLFSPLQTETYRMVREGDRHLALVAPTSSGKTLAIAAPLFESRKPAVFVYPFRALILDQTNQLIRYGSLFGLTKNDFSRIWGGMSHAEIAQAITKPYVLITPDKLISLFDGGRTGVAAAMTLLSGYDFVFDEVHCYNSLMQASLKYFIRSVQYWQSKTDTVSTRFYFLSATFPDDLWEMLQSNLGMTDNDRVEGVSFTGDVKVHLRPYKYNAKFITSDMHELGMVSNVVGIFNSPRKAWDVAYDLDPKIASQSVFVGQDKISEKQRIANFRRFEDKPDQRYLLGSSAIEAGVDFDAANFVIEETHADSMLQRFGRAARSGEPATILLYSSLLYSKYDQLRSAYERQEFQELLRSHFPLREPSKLLTGLATYSYYKLWVAPDFISREDLELCKLLDEKGVDRLFAFRGLTPFMRYESGEYISYRTLFLKKFKVHRGKIVGSPSLERYYSSPSRKNAVLGKVKSIAWKEKTGETLYLLAKVHFEGFGTHWTVLEISPERDPHEEDDNICLRIGRNLEYGRIGKSRNRIVKFWTPND